MTAPIFEKNLAHILQEDPQSMLGWIQKKVIALQKINLIWQTELSPNAGHHSRVANFRDHCLIIEIDNAAWATRLRFILPELTVKLSTYPELQTLKRIAWYIQPPTYHKPMQKNNLTLTAESAQLLHNAAATIETEALKNAVVRLAEHGQRKKTDV
jgi:hypothetical protein